MDSIKRTIGIFIMIAGLIAAFITAWPMGIAFLLMLFLIMLKK